MGGTAPWLASSHRGEVSLVGDPGRVPTDGVDHYSDLVLQGVFVPHRLAQLGFDATPQPPPPAVE